MPRRGTAKVKKADKYVYVDADDKELTPPLSDKEDVFHKRSSPVPKKVRFGTSDNEYVDPVVAHEPPKLSIPDLAHKAEQPRQDSATVEQSVALANSLFPDEEGNFSTTTQKDSTPRHPVARKGNVIANRVQTPRRVPTTSSQQRQPVVLDQVNNTTPNGYCPDTMIQGGASIPPNQQRNMRACMVCSIVRTQQQFMTQGCPNCEELLELAGNPEQINDCTSQVFEGLISVADTKRSWVARYQRLEGYVAGVYATQVEGILPEDVLVAVENAGINYVPRDGSEQEMLGKD